MEAACTPRVSRDPAVEENTANDGHATRLWLLDSLGEARAPLPAPTGIRRPGRLGKRELGIAVNGSLSGRRGGGS